MKAVNVSEDTLNKMIAQTYHWQSLPPHIVYGMAVELSKSRYLLDKQYRFIGEILAARDVEVELQQTFPR